MSLKTSKCAQTELIADDNDECEACFGQPIYFSQIHPHCGQSSNTNSIAIPTLGSLLYVLRFYTEFPKDPKDM
ncbi:eukaryotic ribosome biogenesis protein 1 [Aspergillus luchuensis]|uniref:Eukaryotic ribosome biogenesis protein 1 n=1 Tax=Aspergillus kawachii TaxID=1069201 RepID=A0A146G1S4_ASPKA|nr:eukaryotic ribosome biogenesis protein 1 [Aspergillus luchuensis]